MLKILLTLAEAEAVDLTDDQLEDIVYEFGENWPIHCSIPVGILVDARKELSRLLPPPDPEMVERSLEAVRKGEVSTIDEILDDLPDENTSD